MDPRKGQTASNAEEAHGRPGRCITPLIFAVSHSGGAPQGISGYSHAFFPQHVAPSSLDAELSWTKGFLDSASGSDTKPPVAPGRVPSFGAANFFMWTLRSVQGPHLEGGQRQLARSG